MFKTQTRGAVKAPRRFINDTLPAPLKPSSFVSCILCVPHRWDEDVVPTN